MNNADVLCLSHLRYGFVFQRPNHLMTRCARERRVFFLEEPTYGEGPARLEVQEVERDLTVVTPVLPSRARPSESARLHRELVDSMVDVYEIVDPVLWFYTPMMLPLVSHLPRSLVVYDCMDELSGFAGAPPELAEREAALFGVADLVFTGGHSLYAAKRERHPRVHAFPSSVDASHFRRARGKAHPTPPDQADIGGPRIGFFGVVDERMDLELLARVATERPNYQLIMLGPVVKIDPASLPRLPNIHWLGAKPYERLPAYLHGWDVAMMPFALNDATRFISPTKTLEYLAAGKPVVSTAIRDVVTPYGEQGLVRIADRGTFAAAIDRALTDDVVAHEKRADRVLAATSWERTWSAMSEHMESAASLGRAADLEEVAPCSTI